ncbi:hypothetical protein [Sinobacterium caligoides]|nr:hypothetical protein [Sinobacterium caligoides]
MNDKEDAVATLIDNLNKNDSLRRKHASFWNFHNKAAKERGLFAEVYPYFCDVFGEKIEAWGLCEQDPPDIVVSLSNGRLKGVEITELVNERAIDAQLHNPSRYIEELFRFRYREAVVKLHEILVEKERKLKAVQDSYDGLSLLIHTDELLIDSDRFSVEGARVFARGSSVFDGVYLLFSYEPEKERCPIIRLI